MQAAIIIVVIFAVANARPYEQFYLPQLQVGLVQTLGPDPCAHYRGAPGCESSKAEDPSKLSPYLRPDFKIPEVPGYY